MKNLTLMLFICFLVFIENRAFAQQSHNNLIKYQVIELEIPEKSNFIDIADTTIQNNNINNPNIVLDPEEEDNLRRRQVLTIPSFEQATIGNYAFGGALGTRRVLGKYGLFPVVNYMNNNFQKLHGGFNPKNAFIAQGLTSVILNVDTEKLMKLKNGYAYALFQNSVGPSIDQDYVGDVQAINNFDTRPITQLTEYWYRHSFLRDKLRIKIGKQDANLELAVLAPGSRFMNFAFSSSRTIPIPTFPATAGGISTLIQPSKFVNLRAGWFNALNPNRSTEFPQLFTSKTHFTIAEIDLYPTFKYFHGKQLYGIWHDNRSVNAVSSEIFTNPGTFKSNFGIYAGINPLILKKNKIPGDLQGLSLVGQFGWAPQDRNPVTRTYALGIQYEGLTANRTKDVIGTGVGVATLSKFLSGAKNEVAYEVFYYIQLKPWMFIEPDFQIVFHPGGAFKNAYVLCLRAVITL